MSWSNELGEPIPGPTAGNDSFAGTEGPDVANGEAGDDTLTGSGADDTLEGGADYDEIRGGAGDDLLTDSGDGAYLLGEEGNDTLVAVSDGGHFGVAAEGGSGNDSIAITGPDGAYLVGGDGDDTIIGGDGDDLIFGDAYGDIGDGNDSIIGGLGDDTIDAGRGDDIVVWRPGDGNDSITLGEGADTLDLQGGGWDGGTANGDGSWTFSNGTNSLLVFDFNPNVDSVVCFLEGTRIMTARGEVPVEQLRAGELLLSPGGGAPLRPLHWVGHTRVDIVHHGAPAKVAPVLVSAGALGAGIPHRDLRVSPDHAFLLQGRLVPARLLVNGTTILQELWHRVATYWHVEFEVHGLVVAEGALAESYFDDGNRHLFDNAGVIALQAEFGAARIGGRYAAEACAPPILTVDDPALPTILAGLPRPRAVLRRA
jgi:Ca2+-binding RTX toxin-like protein